MGFFEENAKTANGYQLVHWIPTFFDMKNGGCCKIKIWFPSIYVNKKCLNFFVQLLGGCVGCLPKPSKALDSRWGFFYLFWYGFHPSLRISSHCHLPMVGFGWTSRSPSICFGSPLKMMRFRSTCGVRYDTLEIRCFFFSNGKLSKNRGHPGKPRNVPFFGATGLLVLGVKLMQNNSNLFSRQGVFQLNQSDAVS